MGEMRCKDCEYYIQHYRKEETRYATVNCGHCVNKKPSGHFRKTDKICEYYQEKDTREKKQEQMESITEYLSLIAGQLNELKEILKDEA